MKKTRTLSLILLVTFSLTTVISVFSMVSADVTDEGFIPEPDREKWWDSRWHYRKYVEVDPNGYARRWGNLIAFDGNLDGVTGLDINSIRVVRDGKEIPSAYDSSTDTIEMVLDETMMVGDIVPCTVYYDTEVNGLKPSENPLAWVNDYLERYNELVGTAYSEGEIEEEFEGARDEFIADNSITYDTENDIYTYQGYTVQYDFDQWQFLDGTIVQFYFIGTYNAMLGGVEYQYDPRDGSGLVNVALEKDDGSWWYWNTQTETYESWNYNGQSIFLGTLFEENVDGELAAGEADLGPDGAIDLNLVKYVDDAYATFYDGSQWVMEDILVRVEREVPEAKAFVSTEQVVDISAWGSALFNINGSIQLDDVYLNHLNFEDWFEQEFGWIDDMTPVGGYMEDIENEYADDWSELRDNAARIAIVSEQPAINIDDFDFDVDGYDMTAEYDTGNANTVAIDVIPILIDSRYVGLYDILSKQGFGFVFDDQAMYTNILIEAWRETLDDDSINYYLNLSFNYLDWWYDSIQDDQAILDIIAANGGNIHLSEDGEFNFAITYLSDIDPSVTLQDVLGKIGGTPVLPEEIVTEVGEVEEAIPLEIGTIIAPVKVTVGDIAEVVVGIKGETLGSLVYTIDGGPEIPFDLTYDFIVNNADPRHYGSRGETGILLDTLGNKQITVIAYDTNGAVISESKYIMVAERASVIWTWAASILASIFGIFGVATIKKKAGARNPANCIGGNCNI